MQWWKRYFSAVVPGANSSSVAPSIQAGNECWVLGPEWFADQRRRQFTRRAASIKMGWRCLGERPLSDFCLADLRGWFWSGSGAAIIEIIATLLTDGPLMPTAGLERSVRKAECRFPV